MLSIKRSTSWVSRVTNASTVPPSKVSEVRGILTFGMEEDTSELMFSALCYVRTVSCILYLEDSEQKVILANRCLLLARQLPLDSCLVVAQA